MFKDKSLVVSNTIVNTTRKVVIKRNQKKDKYTKLSDVLTELPSGIVYKDETGMGATTLEMKTERNSIIVEPIKVTASSKAASINNTLYVGSSTKLFPNPSEKNILEYLKDSTIKYKKVVVVADSLHKVIRALESISSAEHEKYFLLIDEVDSFQLDSSYRGNMEKCIETYFKFPKDKRAVLSATEIKFSNPLFQTEPKTLLRYNKPQKRSIDLINTDKILSTAADIISEKLQAFPNDKIVVAYNAIEQAYDIIQHLIKEGKVLSTEVKLMCGNSNRSNPYLKHLFHELDEDVLPSRLTFLTSAYFTGFDLNENYHLISISSNTNDYQSLSEKKLKQIAGRCRKGLLSETVIFDLVPKHRSFQEAYDLKQILESTKRLLSVLNDFKTEFFNDPILGKNLKETKLAFLKTNETEGHSFIRDDSSNTPCISYFNIDSYLEGIRVMKKVFSSKLQLQNILKLEGHNTTFNEKTSSTVVLKNGIVKSERSTEIRTVVEMLRAVNNLDELKGLVTQSMSKIQKTIIAEYSIVFENADKEVLLDTIAKYADKPARLTNLFAKLHIAKTADDSPIIDAFKKCFEIGKEYSQEEIVQKMNRVSDLAGFKIKYKTIHKASRDLKKYAKVFKPRDENRKETGKRVIVHFNPMKKLITKDKTSFGELKPVNNLSYYEDFTNQLHEIVKKAKAESAVSTSTNQSHFDLKEFIGQVEEEEDDDREMVKVEFDPENLDSSFFY